MGIRNLTSGALAVLLCGSAAIAQAAASDIDSHVATAKAAAGPNFHHTTA